MGLLRQLVSDAASLARSHERAVTPASIFRAVKGDQFAILASMRVREASVRWHIPGVSRVLRLAQMTVYGIEISKDARLGDGVNFAHTLGTVIGGDTLIGARTTFLGGITLGSLDGRTYPTIDEDVTIGAGARILGGIHIGQGAKIGANAVVLSDVPAGAIAVGIPAVVRAAKKAPVEGTG